MNGPGVAPTRDEIAAILRANVAHKRTVHERGDALGRPRACDAIEGRVAGNAAFDPLCRRCLLAAQAHLANVPLAEYELARLEDMDGNLHFVFAGEVLAVAVELHEELVALQEAAA